MTCISRLTMEYQANLMLKSLRFANNSITTRRRVPLVVYWLESYTSKPYTSEFKSHWHCATSKQKLSKLQLQLDAEI